MGTSILEYTSHDCPEAHITIWKFQQHAIGCKIKAIRLEELLNDELEELTDACVYIVDN